MHKNIYPDATQSLTKYFKPARIVGGRRNRSVRNKDMIVPNLKSDKGRCAFAYRGPNHWNKLDPALKTIEKLPAFHREIVKLSSSELDNHPT